MTVTCPRTAAVPSATSATAASATAGLPSARQITAWALRISPELARSSSSAAMKARASPVIAYATVVEAYLLAGLAHRELGDQRAASQAAEQALALAESDRLILPFAMTGSAGLLEALPRHETAHAALLADILDLVHGSSLASKDQPAPSLTEELSPGELRVLRYLPTNLSRSQIAGELSVSQHTVSTHIRSIYAKLGVADRSAAVRRARELRLLAAGGRLFLVRAQRGVRHPPAGTPPGIQLGHQILEGSQVLADPGEPYGDDPVGQFAFCGMLVDQRAALLVRERDGVQGPHQPPPGVLVG